MRNLKEKLEAANVVELYNSGNTLEEIASKIGCGSESIRLFLKRNNVQLRKAKRRESLRRIYPVGTKFGQWTVISEEIKRGTTSRNLFQKCQCQCGAIHWKSLISLRNGSSTRCKKCGNKTFFTNEGAISINSLIASYFTHILGGLQKRKVGLYEFNITPEYLVDLYEAQHHRCALSGLPIEPNPQGKCVLGQPWSLDRIDSSKGYIKGNVQWVDKRINLMKQSLPQEEFINLCKSVAQFSRCE